MQSNKELFFFIGTEAELIKLAPIINRLNSLHVPFKLISTGQNDLSKSRLLKECHKGKIDILLSTETIKKTPLGLFEWWLKTYLAAPKKLDKYLSKNQGSIIIVHGDTISTFMGALLAKKYGLEVAHVEAGLRSFHLLSPFPEELDRVLTSRNATIHFAPNEWALGNLKHKHGAKINTYNNTLIEALEYSEKFKTEDPIFSHLPKKFFIFAFHRQENLLNKKLVRDTITEIIKISEEIPCIFIGHAPTLATLTEVGIIDDVKNNPNITIMPRLQYFDFMELIKKSEFVISDGGSNQEELYYLDKPGLILRKRTERIEGLGENIILYKGNLGLIQQFAKGYKDYKKKTTPTQKVPSEIIVEELLKRINNG
ncbi:MAG: UDP-N-acetylglucosamine 2-epimerase [Bacillota bacterium]|nr:UDP-N-acetylglucosamine 2-epimerase [Bacillota bacterium]